MTVLSDDSDAPYDRPNLSKDYLAGQASEDWIPLRPPSFYADNAIELRLGTRASRIDLRGRQVLLHDGGEVPFDRLLIATGAEPVRPAIPGAEAFEVMTLRSLRDCRAMICDHRHLHALWWPARRGTGGRRHRPMPVAPRLFQLSHR